MMFLQVDTRAHGGGCREHHSNLLRCRVEGMSKGQEIQKGRSQEAALTLLRKCHP